MAITAITVTQDNKINTIDLMAAHSPLVFIAKATFTGDAPNVLYATINGTDYKCAFYEDNSATERSFLFVADEIIRAELDKMEDIVQTANTIISVTNQSKEITINFNNGDAVSTDVTIRAVHAARDFESQYGATLVDQYNNDLKYYTSGEGKLVYLYWYNDNAANVIARTLDGSELTLTFNANVGSGEVIAIYWTRQEKTDNIFCNNNSPIMYLEEGVEYNAGADISETIDNIIAFAQSTSQSSYECFTFTKSGSTLIIEDTSVFWNGAYYTGTTANVSQSFVNKAGQDAAIEIYIYPTNLNIGDVLAFNLTIDGNTELISLTAVSDFPLGATAADTMNNYVAALKANYPDLNDFFIYEGQSLITVIQANSYGVSFAEVQSDNSDMTITAEATPTGGGGTTYDKGFVRLAIEPSQTGEQNIPLYINSIPYTHRLNVREFCSSSVMVKYLDRNGEYRFFPFSQYYERISKPEKIGQVDNLIISLQNDSGNTKNIGYKNSDQLTLNATLVNQSELSLLKDLYNSSDVYILTSANKWLQVTIKGDNVSKKAKAKFSDISITVILPKSYNVTQL
jgi:hypothetical protein